MLEFRILGPIEVLRDGSPVALGGAKQRALVADLALHANAVLPAERIVDDLWGPEPPETATHMLHVYVSRLRKALADPAGRLLATRPPGYLLTIEPPDELDASRFETQVRRGREALGTHPGEALAIFDGALDRWRGRALEEFADEPFAQPSAARLEELHQTTLEDRIEALLALGRHEQAVAELEDHIARFPLRERLRELQMLALYRSGRQADALQAYQTARRLLADELGVDPGSGLASLEQAILRHDPALAPSPIPAPVASPEPARPSAGRSTRAWSVAAVAVSALLAVALVTLRLSADDPVPSTSASPVVTGSPEPAVEPSEPRIRWTEVADPGGQTFGGRGDQVILGGVVMPDGLLAVGYSAYRPRSQTGPFDYDAAVWRHTGARGWTQMADATFTATGNQVVTDATVVDDMVVAIGSDASAGDHDAAIWTLDLGSRSWTRVTPDARGFREAGDQWMRGVTWTGSLVVVVGVNRRVGADADAAIWTSSDGSDWTVLVPTSLGVPGDQEMTSVTTFGDVVVAGGFAVSGSDRDAAVWVSPDGSTWQPVVDVSLGGDGDQQINAVAPGGPGLVAVGSETVDDDRDAAVWISADGLDWRRVPDPGAVLGGLGDQDMSSVVSSEGTIVAAGTETVAPETDGAVWYSLDGSTWFRQSPTSPEMSTFTDFGRQAIRELLDEAGILVALGREGRGVDDDADVWTGRLRT